MNRLITFLVCFLMVPLFSTGTENPGGKKTVNPYPVKIYELIRRSGKLATSKPDSAIYYAEKAKQLLAEISSDSARSMTFIKLGDLYFDDGNFVQALANYLEAEKLTDDYLIKEPGNPYYLKNQFTLTNKIGLVYYSQKNLNLSLRYFNDALDIINKIPSKASNITDSVNLIKVMSNIAAIYIQQKEYERALEYYKSVMRSDILPALKKDRRIESSLYNNMGICYMELRRFDMADNFFRRALELREKNDDKRGSAQCLNNIGKNYVYTGNFNLASDHFIKALKLGRESGSKESVLISLESLSSISDTLGQYKKALKWYKEYKALSDSIFNIESANKISQLGIQYEFEKQQKIFDFELQRREAKQKSAELIYIIVGGSLFFLLISALMLFFLQRSKLKNTLLEKDKLELENKHNLLEKEKLTEELEFKKRELTTNVMYLLKKNELITGIIEKMIHLKSDSSVSNQKVIQDIIKELKSAQDADVWSEFEAHFTHVHFGFYERLNKLFPDLSSNEKKLCAFLRLNLSTKDISAITYQSVNSITVARSRLRKKLNIHGEDTNLVNFLMEL